MALVTPAPVCQHCGLPEVAAIHEATGPGGHAYAPARIDRATISIPKAVELVGVSRRTIYNWMAAGKVEWTRTASGTVRIFVDSLWRGPEMPQERADRARRNAGYLGGGGSAAEGSAPGAGGIAGRTRPGSEGEGV